MSPIYIFYGENEFLKQQRVDELKQKIASSKNSPLSYENFEAADDFNIIKESLQTLSLFGPRLVVIHKADKFTPAQLERIFSLTQSNPELTVILNSEKKDFQKQIPLSSGTKVQVFEKIYANKIPSWLRQRAGEKGLILTSEAVSALTERLADNLQLLDTALDILMNFAADRRKIEKEDVEKIIGVNLDESAFVLADAVANKNVKKALVLSHRILKTGAEAHQILGVLAWHFNRIAAAKKIIERCGSPQARRIIQKALSIRDFFMEKFMRQVDNFSLEQIKKLMEGLLEADINIKSLRAKSQYILEVTLVKLCGL